VNATNFRDLGGLRTRTGRVVRSGLVYRSNALHQLSDDDLLALDSLGLACVIDFRHAREIETVGADRLPARRPARLVGLPLFDSEKDFFGQVAQAMNGQGDVGILDRLREDHPSGGASAAMRDLYRWFAAAPRARDTFAAALRLAAASDALPLLFHCTAGKDRTGWLAGLILSALDVEREVIIADYLRTNELNATNVERTLAGFRVRVPDVAVLRPLFDARRDYLEGAFDEVDSGWGGVEAYLQDGLGLDETTLTSLRTLLLD
jgi:protein-tyrosine phosphatase